MALGGSHAKDNNTIWQKSTDGQVGAFVTNNILSLVQYIRLKDVNLQPSYTADLVKLRQLSTQMSSTCHLLCISYMSLAKIY